jgi:hypothetical protein
MFGKLARPKRFELLTHRFVVWCSIQLSYGRAGLEGRVVTSAPIPCKGNAEAGKKAANRGFLNLGIGWERLSGAWRRAMVGPWPSGVEKASP